ncbi:MAG: leucyl/phenylalanyl-tRNA--protein transferase [Hyphomonadaceae bacterium]|nr:leucyl/phenylalanyl-tRNA--protein transferase [Hyphomonadaceae bacterium]
MRETAFGPDALLDCYARGVFPMADGRDDPRLFLVDPLHRGILPLDSFHVPRRLARTVRRQPYQITADTDFEAVLTACAAAAPGRLDTWINQPIQALYSALHRRGHAHSLEVRDQAGTLVGGLYGVRLGSAFFGESMFSCARDASKIALVHLVAALKAEGFTLLDSQFLTAHLSQFGALEIPRADYQTKLAAAVSSAPVFAGSFPGRSWDQLGLHSGAAALQVLQPAPDHLPSLRNREPTHHKLGDPPA